MLNQLRNMILKQLVLSMSAICAMILLELVPCHAQTNITGDIVGIVSDSTGAIVPGATVTVTNLATGSTRAITTSSAGEYRISQLAPGSYSVIVMAAGFEKSKQTLAVNANTVASANAILSVGKTNVTIEVNSGEVPLLHLDDAQLSSAFTEEQIQSLPNPGNDLTFITQTAPGTVMNTQSGYGNFSSFGLPGTANSFTVDGGNNTDPFLNLNNSGASNLLLGANDVAVETVTSNAYNASFGGLGGAQVSEISRSGGNKFHGNAAYWWNGSILNANDYFNKQSGTSRLFDNANQWAGAIGGPIKHNKTFFFADFEGLAVVVPHRGTIYAPDAAYQAQVLTNLSNNSLASEIPIYKNIFNLYNNAKGYSSGSETSGCTTAPYCTWTFNGSTDNYTHEWLLIGRIDHSISDKDHLFGRAVIDRGTQATYANLLSSLFNGSWPQPSYQGELAEQHTFSPMLNNQFIFSTSYSSAMFGNLNQAASEKLVPFTLIFADSDLSDNPSGAVPGGTNDVYPEGRVVTYYQFQDDLSWTKGKHTVSAGWTMRRDDVTDHDYTFNTSSPYAYTTSASFEQGYVDYWSENFPTRLSQPLALYSMGGYIQDQWKLLPNLTITYGMRMEHNSDPVCQTNCFSHLSGNFADISTSTSTAYDTLIAYNQHTAMPSLQSIGWEPRFGFAYLPFGSTSKTTVRGGFGLFDDALPGYVAELYSMNAPTTVPFTVYGPAYGGSEVLLVPGATSTVTGAAGSAASVAAASDKAFVSGFADGASYSSLSASMSTAGLPTFIAPTMANPAKKIKNPVHEEWSLAVEQQLNRFDSISVMYVGNVSYHGPMINNGVNAYRSSSLSGFSGLSTTAPNRSFRTVSQLSSVSNGNFNGLVLSAQHRSRSLTLTFNYQWSHALDDNSNGGISAYSGNSLNQDNPSNLRDNYGNADYDTRQYVSSSYVYSLPHFRGPKLLADNWQFAGTVFHSTGLPFSIIDGTTAYSLRNYGGPLYAKQTTSINGHNHCGGNAAAQGTQCAFAADYSSATDFGQSRRNQLFGPNYTDVDLTVTKGITVPRWDIAKVKIGAQFFNLFNHTNFGQPYNNLSSGSSLGTITYAVSAPTSILGCSLGGDASPRLIQLIAKFDF